MLLVLLTAALFQAGEPAAQAAQTTPTAAAPAASTELKPGERREKVICRTEVTTGTRFGKRVCLTVADMERRTEGSREALDEVQRRVSLQPTGN